MLKKTIVILAATLLSACGGGDDSPSADSAGDQSSQQDAQSTSSILSFDPNIISLNATTGAAGTVTVKATATDPTKKIWEIAPYFLIVDEAQVLSKHVEISDIDDRSVNVAFHTPATLAIGHYQGKAQVHFCNDAECTSEVTGSPVSIPYDLTITGPTAP